MCKGKQIGLLVIALTTVSVLLASTAALAQGGGKGRGEKPGGWVKGEKKAWKGDIPRGIEEKGGWIPQGLSKEDQAEWKDGRPPGWSHGEKEGWKSADMPPGRTKNGAELPPGLAKSGPPGWGKWNDEKKKTWQKELSAAKGNVRRKAKRVKGFSKTSLDSALLSLEMAARRGVPIKHARGIVEEAMGKGIKGRGIEAATRAMANGVGKEVDFDQLGRFVRKKLDQGLRDDGLAIEIYKEIARRSHTEARHLKGVYGGFLRFC